MTIKKWKNNGRLYDSHDIPIKKLNQKYVYVWSGRYAHRECLKIWFRTQFSRVVRARVKIESIHYLSN